MPVGSRCGLRGRALKDTKRIISSLFPSPGKLKKVFHVMDFFVFNRAKDRLDIDGLSVIWLSLWPIGS
jgi:hypothetical protein